MNDSLLHQIALTLLPRVGDRNAKLLLSYCGSAEAIFKEKKSALLKIPGIGSNTISSILNHNTFERAEEEIDFIEREGIKAIFYSDKEYPFRLKHCEDGPILIYYRGNEDLNNRKFISIVGTRNATEYGKEQVNFIIEGLKPYEATIVSGLAYGIDICAHKTALDKGLATIGVVAHGLDRMYPGIHNGVAKKMLDNGGIVTDFMSRTNPDRENFPKRNRIIAGLSDAVIVVEAAKKGGALITADIANSYNRDVFAVPGRLGDVFSEGCNLLIKSNKAALIQSVKDLEYIMGWEVEEKNIKIEQPKLFIDLNSDEELIVSKMLGNNKLEVDNLSHDLSWPISKTVAILSTLELKGVVKSFPGKLYELV